MSGRLFDAAMASGLVDEDGTHSVRVTIKSGLDAGEKKPHASVAGRDDYQQANDADGRNFNGARAAVRTESISVEDFHAYMPMHSYLFATTGEPWPAARVN